MSGRRTMFDPRKRASRRRSAGAARRAVLYDPVIPAWSLMQAQPSLIKRPVLDGAKLLVGFKPEIYAETFKGR
jgi:arsenate reductase-like glutaredoxin family protein